MAILKQITVEIDAATLAEAQAATGKGVTETVREALERLARIAATQRLMSLKGKLVPALGWEELRGKADDQ